MYFIASTPSPEIQPSGAPTIVLKVRCMRILAALLIGFVACFAQAAAQDPVSIPDAALRHCIEQALGKSAGAPITEEEMAGIGYLGCALRADGSSPHGAVSSLAGLEHATGLSSASLVGNAISDLTPLAGLTSLNSLYIDNNAISDLTPLAGLTSLTSLHATLNAISDLTPLAGLTSLTSLGLGANSIADIGALAELGSLAHLGLGVNAIADVSALRGLAALNDLVLSENHVVDIAPLAENEELGAGDYITLTANPLNAAAHETHIPALQDRGAMVYFDPPTNSVDPPTNVVEPPTTESAAVAVADPALRHCVERALGKDAGAPIAEDEMATLSTFSCRPRHLWDGSVDPEYSPHGVVSSLAGLEHATGLASLDLSDNAVSDLSPLAGLGSLTALLLSGNGISDLSPLAGLGSLTALHLSGNGVSDLSSLAGLTSLTRLVLARNDVSDLTPLAGLGSLTDLYLSVNAVADVSPLAGLASLTMLGVGDNAIADIGALAELGSLTYLGLHGNAIADVSALRGLAALNNLVLNNNHVVDIAPLAENEGLGAGDYIELIGNPLDAAAHETHIPALQDRGATVHFDPPTNSADPPTNVVEPPTTESATVHIADPALRYCVERALVKDAGAAITEDDMAGLDYLGCLFRQRQDGTAHPEYSPHGTVSSLAGLEHATSLASLTLAYNAVSDLSPLADLGSLTSLQLAGNGLADLTSLADLRSLTVLHLDGNDISDLSPLASLTSLTTLGLGGNAVTDVSPLAGLGSLTSLGLGANAIEDIGALAELGSLAYLGLYSNAIADVSALRGLAALDALYLANNRIADVAPLAENEGLGTGDHIELMGNPIACGAGNSHVHVLLDRGAAVYADAATLPAPRQFAATPGNTDAELRWQAPVACHVVRYDVRYGIGKSPDFGAWQAIGDGSATRHALAGLTNGLLYAFEIRAVGTDGGSGSVARAYATLAESPATPVSIVDARLSVGIARALNKIAGPRGAPAPTPTRSSELVVTQGEMAQLTDLDLRAMDIGDLTGLEYAVNLRSLLMARNHVANLAPIAGLPLLASLDLSANGLSDISSLAAMPSLERIWLNDNAIADIWPLAANAALGEGVARADGSSDYVDLRGNPLNVDALEQHAPALRERGAAVLADDESHLVPLFAAAGSQRQESFVRIVNPTDRDGTVRVTAIDERGSRLGPAILPIEARKTVHFNSHDLENGNAETGLSPGLGAGTGDWRLELRSSLPLEVFAYMRNADGFPTSMTAVAPETYAQHRIPTFNPGSNGNQVSRLRLINTAGKTARVLIEGTDDRGASAQVAVEVPAGGSRDLTAAALERGDGDGIVDGGLGDGAGKWRLAATSYDGVLVLNVLDSPSGHRANLSVESHRPGGANGGVYHLPLLPSALASPSGRTGFVRIVNRSPRAGSVRVVAFDAAGRSQPAGELALDAHGAVHFSSQELEHGNADKGLVGVGVGQGDWRLELRSNLEIGVYGYARGADGFVGSIHELAPTTAAGSHRVAFFNPARNARQASRLRIANTGDVAADVRISGVDDDGNPAAAAVRLTVPAYATRELTAQDLETGSAEGIAGALGEGAGKWRLVVEADPGIVVMSLVEDDAGHLANVSR